MAGLSQLLDTVTKRCDLYIRGKKDFLPAWRDEAQRALSAATQLLLHPVLHNTAPAATSNEDDDVGGDGGGGDDTIVTDHNMDDGGAAASIENLLKSNHGKLKSLSRFLASPISLVRDRSQKNYSEMHNEVMSLLRGLSALLAYSFVAWTSTSNGTTTTTTTTRTPPLRVNDRTKFLEFYLPMVRSALEVGSSPALGGAMLELANCVDAVWNSHTMLDPVGFEEYWAQVPFCERDEIDAANFNLAMMRVDVLVDGAHFQEAITAFDAPCVQHKGAACLQTCMFLASKAVEFGCEAYKASGGTAASTTVGQQQPEAPSLNYASQFLDRAWNLMQATHHAARTAASSTSALGTLKHDVLALESKIRLARAAVNLDLENIGIATAMLDFRFGPVCEALSKEMEISLALRTNDLDKCLAQLKALLVVSPNSGVTHVETLLTWTARVCAHREFDADSWALFDEVATLLLNTASAPEAWIELCVVQLQGAMACLTERASSLGSTHHTPLTESEFGGAASAPSMAVDTAGGPPPPLRGRAGHVEAHMRHILLLYGTVLQREDLLKWNHVKSLHNFAAALANVLSSQDQWAATETLLKHLARQVKLMKKLCPKNLRGTKRTHVLSTAAVASHDSNSRQRGAHQAALLRPEFKVYVLLGEAVLRQGGRVAEALEWAMKATSLLGDTSDLAATQLAFRCLLQLPAELINDKARELLLGPSSSSVSSSSSPSSEVDAAATMQRITAYESQLDVLPADPNQQQHRHQQRLPAPVSPSHMALALVTRTVMLEVLRRRNDNSDNRGGDGLSETLDALEHALKVTAVLLQTHTAASSQDLELPGGGGSGHGAIIDGLTMRCASTLAAFVGEVCSRGDLGALAHGLSAEGEVDIVLHLGAGLWALGRAGGVAAAAPGVRSPHEPLSFDMCERACELFEMAAHSLHHKFLPQQQQQQQQQQAPSSATPLNIQAGEVTPPPGTNAAAAELVRLRHETARDAVSMIMVCVTAIAEGKQQITQAPSRVAMLLRRLDGLLPLLPEDAFPASGDSSPISSATAGAPSMKAAAFQLKLFVLSDPTLSNNPPSGGDGGDAVASTSMSMAKLVQHNKDVLLRMPVEQLMKLIGTALSCPGQDARRVSHAVLGEFIRSDRLSQHRFAGMRCPQGLLLLYLQTASTQAEAFGALDAILGVLKSVSSVGLATKRAKGGELDTTGISGDGLPNSMRAEVNWLVVKCYNWGIQLMQLGTQDAASRAEKLLATAMELDNAYAHVGSELREHLSMAYERALGLKQEHAGNGSGSGGVGPQQQQPPFGLGVMDRLSSTMSDE